MRVLPLLSTVLISLTAVSCGTTSTAKYIKSETKSEAATKYNDPPLVVKKEKFEGHVDTEWGLALSGGGLRSALYSIGVMKSLYLNTDNQGKSQLQKLDIISSVSGGGYAAYWMMTDPQINSGFGVGRLDRKNFPISTCNLLLHSNFVSNKNVLKNIVSSKVTMYEEAIFRTFGPMSDTETPIYKKEYDELSKTTIHDSFTFTGVNKIPYHIVNTTKVDEPGISWKQKLFEFTPDGMGNTVDDHGMKTWDQVKGTSYLKTIAISGAAQEGALKQTVSTQDAIDSSNSESVPLGEGNVTLADGGKSENLGAYALIRRGVKNIIIVDAEHNPNMEFTAYKNLKWQLEEDHYKFSVPAIEEYVERQRFYADSALDVSKLRLEKAVNKGTVEWLEKDSNNHTIKQTLNIYYIKMSISKSIEKRMNEIDIEGEQYKKGIALNDEAYKILKEKAEKVNGKSWHCSVLTPANLPSMEDDNALENWYGSILKSYVEAFPTFNRVKLANRLLRGIQNDAFVSGFPHYSTGDQSFYHDQAVAFMALGYFAAEDMKKVDDLKNIK